MNSNFRKYILYVLGFLGLSTLVFIFWTSDKNPESAQEAPLEIGYQTISGKAFGQDWQLDYQNSSKENLKSSLDSLFSALEKVAFSGNSTSEINRLNNLDTLNAPEPELVKLLQSAQKWTASTDGAVDFTQTSLDRAWNFSSGGARLIDSLGVAPILKNMGINKVIVTDSLIRKPIELKINFSKIIHGYALHQAQALLERKGVSQFRLKLGQTEVAKGQNEREELWKTEIPYLSDSANSLKKGLLAIQNHAISQTGNPEQYYVKDSTRVSFTLDPRTGYPINHGLLAITLLGPNPETSELLANMLMVKGTSEAIRLDSSRNDVQMVLIFSEKGGNLRQYISPDLKKFLSFPVD